MRASVIREFGGAETLTIQEVHRPSAGPGDILVKVFACGVNPVDAKIRRGALPIPVTFPLILGYDVSGVVESVGEGVTEFKAGDEVFYTPGLAGQGAYAEYHAVPASIASLKPEGYSHVEAASVPLAGSTAWQALFERATVQSGDVVLIHGGAGGVGSLAVQLARWAGCEVIATAGPENLGYLEELGADLALDYRRANFVDQVMEATVGRGADVILDTVGGEVFLKSFDALAPGGTVVTVVSETMRGLPLDGLAQAFFKNADACFHFMRPSRASLDNLARLMEREFLLPQVEEVLALEEAAQAHRRMDSGHGRGKIVLELVEE